MVKKHLKEAGPKKARSRRVRREEDTSKKRKEQQVSVNNEEHIHNLLKELKDTKSDLRRVAKELNTSNSRLEKKTEELHQLNDALNNFITSSNVGTISLNKELKIQRFTPAVKNIIDLRETDIGSPISHFVSRLHYDNLVEDAMEVLKSLVPRENVIRNDENKSFRMHILPYRTRGNSAAGVVITFTDITELKKSQVTAEINQQRYKMLFRHMTSGVAIFELVYQNGKVIDAVITEVNDSYFDNTGLKKKDITGKRYKDIFPRYREDLFCKFANVVQTGQPYRSEEYSEQFKRYLNIAAYKFDKNKFILILDDITSRKTAQEEIKKSEEKFRSLFKNIDIGISINKIVNVNGKAEARCIDINPVFERLAGKKAGNLNGKSIAECLNFFDAGIINQIVQAGEEGLNFRKDIFLPDSMKYYSISSIPLSEDQFVMLLEDITETKKEMLAGQHLAAIVESSEDAIYSVSPDAKILSWNKGAERFFGYSAKEIIGKDISVLSSGIDHNKHLELIEQVKNGKKLTNLEIDMKTRDGRIIPTFLTKSPIFDEKGKVIAVSDIVKDITGIKERENELIKAKEKSEKSGRLKIAFLQNVSHEIRTPMNAILGFTEILKDSLEDPESRHYASIIEESGNQLLRLIDDILDISRMEADELTIEKNTFNLHNLMHSLKEQFDGVLTQYGKDDINLKMVLPGKGESTYLYTDQYRLQQIMVNLLSNAIKYTDEGFIEFGYVKNNSDWLFYVKDTGIGIEKEHQKIIFDRFNRIITGQRKIVRGTGLGLSISKGLVNKLGGQIWCESEPGKGSTFFFTIPYEWIEIAKDKITPDKTEDLTIPDLTGKTILIAEDDEMSFLMLGEMLSKTHATILHAKDGDEAIKMLDRKQIDLAMLDIRMPKKSGYEVLRVIKQKGLDIKVIAQTAYAMREEKNKSKKAGFDDHLSKPLSAKSVYGVLNKFIPK